MSCLKNEQDLQALMGQGQMMDAFEKYYAENVVMAEATGEVFEGKDTNRKREQEWLASVQEMHGGGVTGITSNEDEGITMTEAWVEMTVGGNRMKMEEVSVKKWENGLIVHERFYYNVPGQ